MHSTPPSIGSWPWLRERLFPRGTNLIQWASYIILTTILLLYILTPPPVEGFAYYSTLVALALLLVINFLLDDLKRMLPSEQASIWVIMLVSTALTFYSVIAGQMFAAIYILFMISAQANAMLPPAPAVGFSIVIAGAYLGILAWSGATPAQIQSVALGLLIGMTFTITLSQVLLRYSEQTERANHLLEQLQQANAELLAAREKERELTIAEERVRVARDLHDGLGHHLTALSIQLQAAEKLLYANPDQAAEAVHNARGEIQAALQEVRQSVAALREAPVDFQNLPQAIARLVADLGRLGKVEAKFDLEGSPAPLTPAAAMTIYRTAQEGLTNVQKHAAGASLARVRLVYTADRVSLVVEDDGSGAFAEGGAPSRGFGLAGLSERAALLGGSLHFGPQAKGGFRIEINLPLAARPEGAPL